MARKHPPVPAPHLSVFADRCRDCGKLLEEQADGDVRCPDALVGLRDCGSESYRHFACHCGPDNANACAATIAEAILSLSSARHQVTDADLLTAVVYALDSRLDRADARITGFDADQWIVVRAAATYDDATGQRRTWRTFIECDRAEDGLAATWIAMRDRFGTTT